MRPIGAAINLKAIAANLALARKLAQQHRAAAQAPVRLVAVIKADAYGHGLGPIGRFLDDKADMLAVASIDEGMILRQAGIRLPVLLLGGAFNAAELPLAEKHNCIPVVHQQHQLKWLQVHNPRMHYWIKLETGMHRMGLDEFNLSGLDGEAAASTVVMHHYACADTPDHPLNQIQSDNFARLLEGTQLATSCANSAAICGQRLPVGDYIRPGLMLYGASPLAHASAVSLGLQPAMQLASELISCKPVKTGETVGYGADFVAPQDGYIGLVACGYGDGYPREFIPQAEPWATVAGVKAKLAGRVSMDSLALWLGNKPQPLGSSVTLWGDSPRVEQLAAWAGTTPYTLLTRVAPRVQRIYAE